MMIPTFVDFIVATLEEQGYAVRQASDGPHGLAELARQKADLVVLDFIMPGMSGAEVARRILADMPNQPILFVSGYSETDAVSGRPQTPRCCPNRSGLKRWTRPFAQRLRTKAERTTVSSVCA